MREAIGAVGLGHGDIAIEVRKMDSREFSALSDGLFTLEAELKMKRPGWKGNAFWPWGRNIRTTGMHAASRGLGSGAA